MASNTGCTSVSELLMTFRISAVAVCCSSASFVSLNSRTFSIAITAWSAKVCSSATYFSSKTPASRRATAIAPIATPLAHHRRPSSDPTPYRWLASRSH